MGIEPATFRLVTLCRNQLRHRCAKYILLLHAKKAEVCQNFIRHSPIQNFMKTFQAVTVMCEQTDRQTRLFF